MIICCPIFSNPSPGGVPHTESEENLEHVNSLSAQRALTLWSFQVRELRPYET
jgi:hypothetical protein